MKNPNQVVLNKVRPKETPWDTFTKQLESFIGHVCNSDQKAQTLNFDSNHPVFKIKIFHL